METSTSARSWLSLSGMRRLLRAYSFGFALLLAAILLIANLIATKNFGWVEQLATFAPLAVAAMAMTPAIISGGGGFDMSISPVMTLVGILYVQALVPAGLGGFETVLIVLACGALVGALNGLIIVTVRVPPMVVTLATYFIFVGIDLKLTPIPVSLQTDNWLADMSGMIGPIPGPLIFIAAPVIIWVLLGLIPYRRTLYMVGSNDATAYSTSVNVGTVRIIAYALGGLFAAFGGLALTALVGCSDSSTASAYTLIAIAAVALGGTSLWGGRGGVLGSLIGAACIYLLQSLLQTAQVSPTWLQVIYGLMLLFAVVFGMTITRVRKEVS